MSRRRGRMLRTRTSLLCFRRGMCTGPSARVILHTVFLLSFKIMIILYILPQNVRAVNEFSEKEAAVGQKSDRGEAGEIS